jgi:hypothetical protein
MLHKKIHSLHTQSLTSVPVCFVAHPSNISKQRNTLRNFTMACCSAPSSTSTPTADTCSAGDCRSSEILDSVIDYYGKDLQSTEDLRTDACKTTGAPPLYQRKVRT